ncbi:MAG: transposase [bacterium]
MGHPVRFEFPGAVYHIYSRGNRKEKIYLDNDDRKLFLEIFSKISERYSWICHAYCLMGNHYHFLLEIPHGILAPGMQDLNSLYARKFNQNHAMVGHLFQGRYKAELILDSNRFLLTARYICRNPVEASIVEDASQWLWSSYRATIGLSRVSDFLTVDVILSCLDEDKSKAQRYFNDLVHLDISEEEVDNLELVVPDRSKPDPKTQIRTLLDMRQSVASVARMQRMLSRPHLEELFHKCGSEDKKVRNRIIWEAYKLYRYSQSDIGRFLDLNRATISRIITKKRL